MAVTATGDIQINGLPYILSRKGYNVGESARSMPRFGGATDKEFIMGDNWSRFGQSDFIGDSQDDWLGDGPFQTGYGIDISAQNGAVKVAKALASTQADANNAGGYIAFAAGTTRMWWLGKTNGTGYHTTDGTNWTTLANALAAGPVLPTSWLEYKGTYYVGGSDGKIYSNTGGATFTQIAGAAGTAVYLLGVYKGKMYAGYNNALWNWDGTTWRQQFLDSTTSLSLVTGLPIIGKVANSFLYFMTQGPQSILYMTDSNQLYQIAQMGSDYLPKAMVFAENLLVFGGTTDDAITNGSVHRLDKNGFIQIYEWSGLNAFNATINSAIEYAGRIVWTATHNNNAAIGVYDPTLDLFVDSQMGFYLSSATGGATLNGLCQFNNILFVGLAGVGIYKQGTPGTYSITSCMFDGGTKNLNKIWGFAEAKHSALIAGQTVVLKTSKDGTTFTSWTASPVQAAGDVASLFTAPTSPYKSPYLQYQISGTANGSDLYLYDVSLSYIDAPDNPKREWDIIIELSGGPNSDNNYQVMRDESLNTRSATQMLTELNALWNTQTTFDDLDGTRYNVVFRAPRQRTEDLIKDIASGTVTDLVVFYGIHLVQM